MTAPEQPTSTSRSLPTAGPSQLFDTTSSSLGIRLLQRWIGLPEMDELYERAKALGRPSYYRALLEVLGAGWTISPDDLARVPKEGPVVVVANHPFGMIEGLIAGTLLEDVRPDTRILANSLLGHFPLVAQRCILVDPFGGTTATASNSGGMRQALAWLKRGHLLVVFPAGEVSSFDARRRLVTDPPWNKLVARMACATGAPVLPMFFEGRNGLAFQLASLVHPRLRTALLCREFLNKTGKTIGIRCGQLVSAKRLEQFGSDEERIDYLRRKTYVLAHRGEPRRTNPFLYVVRREKAARTAALEHQEEIVPATDPSVMEAELALLGGEALLDQQGDQCVYIAEANQIPHVVREIGRLREITFRATGEGTGKWIDLDQFDTYYKHLFIWHRGQREVVGAYRLGESDRILPQLGRAGFYTSTLFSYRGSFLERITPALEMGRSFVRQEYQRSYAPLVLLWRGIGVYVSRHPRYKILFGPVSISNSYHPSSRQLIVTFLKEYCQADDLAQFVKAKSPFRMRPTERWQAEGEHSTAWDIEALSTLIADIETDQKGVPVLLRQYLKLGGKLLSFNLDANFSNALDGLIVVDLVKTDPRVLERYMGKTGAERFLRYHRQQRAEAR